MCADGQVVRCYNRDVLLFTKVLACLLHHCRGQLPANWPGYMGWDHIMLDGSSHSDDTRTIKPCTPKMMLIDEE